MRVILARHKSPGSGGNAEGFRAHAQRAGRNIGYLL
jgi:hypothetical protein